MKDYLTITSEDNMDLMARYEDNHFDLAIVDPPYGIGESSNDNSSRSHQINNILRSLKEFLKIKLFGVLIIL